ncbi:MAG TPA: fatty acid--CoA ligase [Chryseolinea sp.]
MKIKKLPPAANAHAFPLLIKSLLAYSLVLEPEREIVYKDLVRYNYHTFNERVRRLSNVLDGLGLKGGETVAVMDYDSHRYLECYFAIPMTGNVLHTINWRLSPAQILYTINHAEDAVLIVNEEFLPVIEKFAGEMPTVRHIIVTTDSPSTHTAHPDYESLLNAADVHYDFPDFDEDAVATTFYTTGTTGDPKGVYFTHRQLVLHTLSLAATFGFVDSASVRCRSNDVYMPLTPMFHVHAWGFPYVATMFSMKQVYIGKLSPPVVADLMRREKPTFSHCVPTILQVVLHCPEAKEIDLTGWKVMIGGAALTKGLAKLALERGVDVNVGFGMSETCPVIAVSYMRVTDADMDIESQMTARTRTGVPTIFTDLQIWNEAGMPVAADDKESGEVVVRSPWLTQGYVKDPEKGAALWKNGYLHTGDMATIDANHSLKISDRIKDVIKSGGEWISSINLESLIALHPGVAEVAVVGLPHAKWGERPHALVVLHAEAQVEQADLKAHIQPFIDQGQLCKWAMPEEFVFVTAIPKTSVGKIDKKRIRSEWPQTIGQKIY